MGVIANPATRPGRNTLYLTNPDHVRVQLRGVSGRRSASISGLMDRISTDEMFPSRRALITDLQEIGAYALTGLRGECIQDGALAGSPVSVLVAGESFGCGSSREHAPLALKKAGIQLVVAKSVERIFFENCVNLGGPIISTDLGLIDRLADGIAGAMDEALTSYDPMSRAIVEVGGLFAFTQMAPGTRRDVTTPPRPMTVAEKILARHMHTTNGCVQPGDTGFADVDIRYTYEIFVPMIQALLTDATGGEWEIARPESLILFNDHLALLQDDAAEGLRESARKLSRTRRITLYDATPSAGAEGICHTILLEKYAKPGQIIVGSDSHTCTSGAVGALAFGIGATEMANALLTNRVRVKVPPTIRVELAGEIARDVMAKDVMLHLLSLPFVQEGRAVGRVLEYSGGGIVGWPRDELAVLTNMAVEAGAFTGLVEPVAETREARDAFRSDPKAEYEEIVKIDLTQVALMIAEPSDPRNAVPLASHHGEVEVDIAYVGSCTSGKLTDLIACASVLKGQQVHSRVRMFVQASSRPIAEEATRLGLVDAIKRAGATFLGPGCGACCGLGPGTSNEGEVTISSTNRNFPGRMGKGDVYLANPAVVAASAVAGRITSATSALPPTP